MKRLIILMGMVLSISLGHAQTRKNRLQHAFDEIRREMHEDFQNFRRQCMEEFIGFLRDPWKEFEEEKPVPKPHDDEIPPVPIKDEKKDKPIKDEEKDKPIKDEEKQLEDKPVVIEEVVEPEPVEPQPQPVEPIEEVPVVEVKYVDFTFFGTSAKVRFDIANKVVLHGVDENSVADALKQMSAEAYDNMIRDCLSLRDSLKLCDWAYLQMLKSLADKIYGKGTNGAALLLANLYVQSGYKMRLATDGSKLYMLYASKYMIYDQNSFTVDGTSYYGVENLPANLFISRAVFPKERELSLGIYTDQQFAQGRTKEVERRSTRYPAVGCTVRLNQNLIDFFGTYPTSMVGGNFMTRWAMYANTPLCHDVKQQLYPMLRQRIAGKTANAAVAVLLDFVQMAFPYGYDDEIWGHDRAFFAEESLWYERCDCEDHAILFSRLVRDLVGLKVVLVYYPGHLATAVHFPEAVTGDYLELNGERFVVCDPTYFGAPIGMTMDGMDNRTAKVILLQ